MIRILIVDQLPILCHVLAAVLDGESDMRVIGYATNLRQALNLTPDSDIILVNAHMRGGSALEFIREINKTPYEVKLMAIGVTESKEQIFQFVQAGAAGYILRDDSVENMLEQIRVVHAGKVRISPRIAAALMSRLAEYAQLLSNLESGVGGLADLTPREQEILDLISHGLTNKQISEQLVIEVGTVKNHVHRILQKLEVDSRHSATAIWTVVKRDVEVRNAVLK